MSSHGRPSNPQPQASKTARRDLREGRPGVALALPHRRQPIVGHARAQENRYLARITIGVQTG
jgi:hypothetical protein